MSETEILEIFKRLDLGTEADRERFLQLERLGCADPFNYSAAQTPVPTIGGDTKLRAVHQ